MRTVIFSLLMMFINATILLPVSAKAAEFSYDDTMQWMKSQIMHYNQKWRPSYDPNRPPQPGDYWKTSEMTWDRFGNIEVAVDMTGNKNLRDHLSYSLDHCTSIKESTKVKYQKGWWMAGCTDYKFPSKKLADRFSKAWNYAYLKIQQEIPF